MKNLTPLLLFLASTLLGHGQSLCHTDILLGEQLEGPNRLKQFRQADFSALILSDDSMRVGASGDNHSRFLIKFLWIGRKDGSTYNVRGKWQAEGKVSSFMGVIRFEKICKVAEQSSQSYPGTAKSRFLGIASFLFVKSDDDTKPKKLSGTYKIRFYQNEDQAVVYDDLDLDDDGYFNNAYVGFWVAPKGGTSIQCNWGDYRVPNSYCDFDDGAGEFHVSETYRQYGWWVKPKRNWWE